MSSRGVVEGSARMEAMQPSSMSALLWVQRMIDAVVIDGRWVASSSPAEDQSGDERPILGIAEAKGVEGEAQDRSRNAQGEQQGPDIRHDRRERDAGRGLRESRHCQLRPYAQPSATFDPQKPPLRVPDERHDGDRAREVRRRGADDTEGWNQ